MANNNQWDGPPLSAWAPWRPTEVNARLQGFGRHWFFVGGWAIDLFLGEETRQHEDIEISIARQDLNAIRAHFSGYPIYSVGDGEVCRLAEYQAPLPDKFQNWIEDPVTHQWRMDIFIRPGDAATWVYRRDESLTLPMREAVSEISGMRILNPEIVLFFKAKSTRDKDRKDFARCLPKLDARARHWLSSSLPRFHPGHEWIGML